MTPRFANARSHALGLRRLGARGSRRSLVAGTDFERLQAPLMPARQDRPFTPVGVKRTEDFVRQCSERSARHKGRRPPPNRPSASDAAGLEAVKRRLLEIAAGSVIALAAYWLVSSPKGDVGPSPGEAVQEGTATVASPGDERRRV